MALPDVTRPLAERAPQEAPPPPQPPPWLRLSDPRVPAPLDPADEAAKKEALAKMKRRATGLLVVAAVVFIVARFIEVHYPWVGAIRAAAEAAMVGGLADWFAVTALFRHPLGLKIPHTAIIPAKKDQVGRTLGNFVQKNFLSRDVLAARLASLHIAEHLARWITEPENARQIASHAAGGLAKGAELLRDEDVQALIDRAVSNKVRSTQVAPLLGKTLALVTSGNRHQELLNEAIKLLAKAVEDNHELIRTRIAEESPWWVPERVDDKIHEKIVGSIVRTLVAVRDDPHHPLRRRFDTSLDDFIERLQTSPDVIERAEKIKQDVLDAEALRRFSESLWSDTKAALAKWAEDPIQSAPGAIERGLNAIGERVLADPVLMEKMDRWVLNIALYLVDRYQGEVAGLIAHTVQNWDPDATSRRIELAIGKDLQFIRINGTLVGGLVGLGLYFIGKLF